ncbi:MAG: class I SAM-dependent methyltransferase [Candidatus Hodarchaeales archaeon]|jgi:SAM-dependent methyltransferase
MMTNFELDASFYDLLVDWDKRLKNELPFFRDLFGDGSSKNILDVACGSGKHALEIAKLGHQVIGIDADLGMIELAQAFSSQYPKLANQVKFVVSSFENLSRDSSVAPGAFNFVICIGNSLSLLPAQDALNKTVAAFYDRLSTGGTLIAQIVNYEPRKDVSHWAGPLLRRSDNSGRIFYFIKFFDKLDRSALRMTITVLYQDQANQWRSTLSESNLYIFHSAGFAKALEVAGFTSWDFYGNYQKDVFLPEKSTDLIVVAKK